MNKLLKLVTFSFIAAATMALMPSAPVNAAVENDLGAPKSSFFFGLFGCCDTCDVCDYNQCDC